MKKSIKIAIGVELLLFVFLVGGFAIVGPSLWVVGLIIWLFLSAGTLGAVTAGILDSDDDP